MVSKVAKGQVFLEYSGFSRPASFRKPPRQYFTHLPPMAHNVVNLLKPTGHVMHHQFNIQQLYILLILYLCVLCLSENKQRLVPITA